MGTCVRFLTAADKPAVMKILRNTPEFLPMEVVVAEELIDAYLADPAGSGYHVVVGEAGVAIVGYACYGLAPMTEGTWDLYWIAVARECQGQGIGRVLMKFVEDWIRQEKGRMVLIETSSKPDYEKTRRFYDYIGYEEIARIPEFYAPGDSMVILMKRLDKGS